MPSKTTRIKTQKNRSLKGKKKGSHSNREEKLQKQPRLALQHSEHLKVVNKKSKTRNACAPKSARREKKKTAEIKAKTTEREYEWSEGKYAQGVANTQLYGGVLLPKGSKIIKKKERSARRA
jgi:hypothetical protein